MTAARPAFRKVETDSTAPSADLAVMSFVVLNQVINKHDCYGHRRHIT